MNNHSARKRVSYFPWKFIDLFVLFALATISVMFFGDYAISLTEKSKQNRKQNPPVAVSARKNGDLERFVFTLAGGRVNPAGFLVGGRYVWVGLDGTIARLDKKTGAWESFKIDTKACSGGVVHSFAEDGGAAWMRIGEEGGACRFDLAAGSWREFFDVHILDGREVAAAGGALLLSGEGGVEHEGVSAFDPKTLAFRDYYHTKPITAMLAEKDALWVGESSGLLRIDMKSGAYRYFLPSETKCGIKIMSIERRGGDLILASRGGPTGYLGDRMELSRYKFRVYNAKKKKWFEYTKESESRDRLNEDIRSGDVAIRHDSTRGGVCVYTESANKWKKFGAESGLPAVEVDSVAAARGAIIASTGRGLAVLPPGGAKFRAIQLEDRKLRDKIRRVESDDKYLWILATDAVYRIDVDKLLKK